MMYRITGKPSGCKLLRIETGIEADCIRSIIIRGDFFAVPEEAFERLEARLSGTPVAGLASRFEELAAEEGIQLIGIHGQAVASLVKEALHAASFQIS